MIKTMLIVDDSRVSRMLVKNFVVKAHSDWTIIEADCADDALSKVEGQAIDIMTLDLNMPGMDGLEL